MKRLVAIICSVCLLVPCLWADGFNPVDPPEPYVTRVLTVEVTPDGAGTVSGAGSYPDGQSVTIKTVAKKNYNFLYWTLNGQPYSETSKTFTYVMGDSAAHFVAHYEYVEPAPVPFDPTNPPEPYATQLIRVSVDDMLGGYTSGSGNYMSGQTVTIRVTTFSTHVLDHWTLNGQVYPETNTSFSYVVGDSVANFVAHLVEKQHVSVQTHPRSAGSSEMLIDGVPGTNMLLAPNTSATLTTTGNPEYQFLYWTLNGTVYSHATDTVYIVGDSVARLVAEYGYLGDGDTTLFNPDSPPEPFLYQQYDVLVVSADSSKGNVTGSGTFWFAANDTLRATPVDGYVFNRWQDGNTDPVRIVPVDQDSLFIAYFGNDTLRLTDTICVGTTLVVGDSVLDHTGYYEFTSLRPDGLVTLNMIDLTVWHAMSSSFVSSINLGDTLYYEGVAYYEDGHYERTLQTSFGCDSLVTFDLTVVWPDYDTTLVARICRGDYYQENGFYEDTEGFYTLNLTSSHHSDSTVHLQLYVDSVPVIYYRDTICESEVYHWRGMDCYVDSTFRDKEYSDTVGGCGYILHELALTVHPLVRVQLDKEPVTICLDEKLTPLDYTTLSGIPTRCDISVAGRRGVVAQWSGVRLTSVVPMPQLPDSVWPDTYQVTVLFYDSLCGQWLDSTRLEVHYVGERVITQRWNDLLAVRRSAAEYYGGFTAYQWYENGKPMTGQQGTQLYLPETGLTGNSYAIQLTREADGVVMMSCEFVPTIEPNTSSLTVSPTVYQAAQASMMRVCAPEQGVLEMYSPHGRLCRTIAVQQGDNYLMAPTEAGMYLVQFIGTDATSVTKKIIVY